mmetsp:Transcript_25539/g.58922  ORF Transcript_25539/g.58922 Transcript_25539/m.58922 type:complete len:321 (+) Transcript_25539:505-1467(+)
MAIQNIHGGQAPLLLEKNEKCVDGKASRSTVEGHLVSPVYRARAKKQRLGIGVWAQSSIRMKTDVWPFRFGACGAEAWKNISNNLPRSDERHHLLVFTNTTKGAPFPGRFFPERPLRVREETEGIFGSVRDKKRRACRCVPCPVSRRGRRPLRRDTPAPAAARKDCARCRRERRSPPSRARSGRDTPPSQSFGSFGRCPAGTARRTRRFRRRSGSRSRGGTAGCTPRSKESGRTGPRPGPSPGSARRRRSGTGRREPSPSSTRTPRRRPRNSSSRSGRRRTRSSRGIRRRRRNNRRWRTGRRGRGGRGRRPRRCRGCRGR